jgi:hypothetical protein
LRAGSFDDLNTTQSTNNKQRRESTDSSVTVTRLRSNSFDDKTSSAKSKRNHRGASASESRKNTGAVRVVRVTKSAFAQNFAEHQNEDLLDNSPVIDTIRLSKSTQNPIIDPKPSVKRIRKSARKVQDLKSEHESV